MMVETTPTKIAPENEEQKKRLESIQQENRVLKMEVETYKLKCKQLQEDNRELRKASVSIVSVGFFFLCVMHVSTGPRA